MSKADLAVLHYKPANSQFDARPEYYAETTDAWIVYPWDPSRARPAQGVGAWKIAQQVDSGATT